MKEQFIHITKDGHILYYKDREMKISHREDGPAIEYAGGEKQWRLNGKLHREDGPAIVQPGGKNQWWLNDKLHREDGPAIDYPHGYEEWYLNGKRHRIDGPAVDYPHGYEEWYLNGKRHRIDGPAVVQASGRKEWWLNGDLHRTDGPAIEQSNGAKEWWLNGKRHREDGPAIEYAEGTKEWWLIGERLSEEDFNKRTETTKGMTMKENKYVYTMMQVTQAALLLAEELGEGTEVVELTRIKSLYTLAIARVTKPDGGYASYNLVANETNGMLWLSSDRKQFVSTPHINTIQ